MATEQICRHLAGITSVKVSEAYVCEECVKEHGSWVHLRTCQTCGATLCCDDSPKQHMTQHYQQSHHPVVASAEPTERWLWCYPDEQFVEY
ncbi:UBP-type zinc finger domain-containing protein [Pedobacter nutrimenti]|jgi:predicted ATP-dependent serine protease|uniref:Ubiquitin-hydrolase Zn-finger-containing protein n=1 Tax=Pedobacter nutrimenti TaxID=1241337 RepID=A0A318UFU3_9SPHI|nr:UBP-type zinc finger domain-containing protein [Pedobacter nutrimenti]PYF75041.1 ubiquitin-hydrolase Zn-finger-containing protein [Pedobacter nutrimenti]